MEPTDSLLIGVDLVKDPSRLEAAYNDPVGLTAEFNRNILRVLNRRFGADFDPESFAHRAFFDPVNAWIEMRLQAQHPVTVRLPAIDLELKLEAFDELRTEISAKYTRESLAQAAQESGLRLAGWFTDPQQLFGLSLLRKAPA
jgi:L-histidine N-alpha-methyltransferase